MYTEKTSSAAERKETCKDGYVKDGSSCKKTTITNASVSYYKCPTGYSTSGSKCTKKTSSTVTESAKTKNGCPNGFTLSNNKCTKKIVIDASIK